jgi:methylase of polypeptide subunit release factors
VWVCSGAISRFARHPQRNIYGCDIDSVAFQFLASVFGSPIDLDRYVRGDFLELEPPTNWPEKFNAVLANPPYIPYQLIPDEQRKQLSNNPARNDGRKSNDPLVPGCR